MASILRTRRRSSTSSPATSFAHDRARSARAKGAEDGGYAVSVGSNLEHHVLRISGDLPLGEGAALALGCDKRLELCVDAAPWFGSGRPADLLCGAHSAARRIARATVPAVRPHQSRQGCTR
jgi:hypothetical protein